MPRRAGIAVALLATLAMGSMPNDHGDPSPENGLNDTTKQDMLIELLKRAVNGTVDVKVTVNGVPPADLLRKGQTQSVEQAVAETSSGEASDSSAASSSGGASSLSSAVVDQDPSESVELVTGPPESDAASSGGASSSGDAISPGGASSSGGASASKRASLLKLESTTAAPSTSESSPAELESKAKELAEKEQALKEKEQALNKTAADLDAKEARLNASSSASASASEPPAPPQVEGNFSASSIASEGYNGFFDGLIKSPMDITWGDKLQGGGLKDHTIVPTLQKMMGDAEGSIDVEITFELAAGALFNGTAGLFSV